MAIIRTQPWGRIVEFYRARATANPFFQPMMILAQQIAASRYASGLYPWTSMQTLCISQTLEADSNKEVLRIWLDPQDGAVVFDFQETHPNYRNISIGFGGVRPKKPSLASSDSFN
jgi:hypothetical protein